MSPHRSPDPTENRNIPNRIAPFLLATLAILATAVRLAGAASPAPIELHGLKAAPPIPFSAPENAGLDALRIVHPADARSDGEKLSLTAVAFPKDSGMSDAELLDYVKTTFLGASASGKPVTRTFLGKKVPGASRSLDSHIGKGDSAKYPYSL